jgi:hypothetical protein
MRNILKNQANSYVIRLPAFPANKTPQKLNASKEFVLPPRIPACRQGMLTP